MFTGLVEDLGRLSSLQRTESGARIVIETKLPDADLRLGASVAVEGACLTVVASGGGRFSADVSTETLLRTTLGSWKGESASVNLERPLALGARLGGHLVLGHVDGVGEIVERTDLGEMSRFIVRLPAGLLPLVVEKGSIALDGISLTVNELVGSDRVALMLIPETLRKTSWGGKRAGAPVNVEADILGKHVARLLGKRSGIDPSELKGG